MTSCPTLLHAAPSCRNQGLPGALTPSRSPTAAFTHLVCFVEEQAEVGEDDPQFLPAIAVLELPQQVSRELVLAQNEKKTPVRPPVTAAD